MKSTLIRPGMTAIAAVIALTSTPLLAQDATPQTAAPTQVAPPTVVPTVPSTAVPTTVTTVMPQPATPVIEAAPVAPAPTVAAEPVEAAPAPVATRERAAPARAAAPRPAARSQRSAAPAPIEAQPVTPPAAVEAALAPLPIEATPAPVVEETAPAPVATAEGNDMLPLVGGGALAVLALGAAGFALSRRRRRDEDFAEEWQTLEAAPEMAAEEPVAAQPAPIVAPAPAMAAAPAARPAFADESEAALAPVPAGPATLPNGFDISQYGRHVQAAYRGPTPNNPFVSLKKRLTRAHFYDMQEAAAAEGATTRAPKPAAPAARPAQDRFEVRSPAKGNTRTGSYRPAFQH